MQTASHNRTIYLKQCPRCNGDVGVGSDQYGRYLHCLQCGYMSDIGHANTDENRHSDDLRDFVA